jgi:hypothetical protein
MDFFQLAFTSIINERESGSIFTRPLNRPANQAQYLKDKSKNENNNSKTIDKKMESDLAYLTIGR